MNPDRLKQIEEIYQAAIELTPNERALFLERTYGDDEDLRREVESLLSFDNTFDSLVDNPAESLAAELFSEQETPQILGQVIGHYKVRSLLGKGAMGEVFLCEDLELKRLVALKILPAEVTPDEGRVRRFVQEARAASW